MVDLRLTGARAGAAERAAVDRVLAGYQITASGSNGSGGPRARAEHFPDAGHAARARRHLLLPVLHAVQADVGWISPGAVNYVALRLSVPPAEVYGVATFYAMFATEPRAPRVVHVCDDIACGARGGERLAERLSAELGGEGSGQEVCWVRSPCLGLCER